MNGGTAMIDLRKKGITSMACLHEEIKTWYFEDTNQPAGMWSCRSCGHKFVPLRLWVGLTEDEFESILKQHNEAFPFAVYQSIEAQLKEKSGG
jgi:hypothetical protein